MSSLSFFFNVVFSVCHYALVVYTSASHPKRSFEKEILNLNGGLPVEQRVKQIKNIAFLDSSPSPVGGDGIERATLLRVRSLLISVSVEPCQL